MTSTLRDRDQREMIGRGCPGYEKLSKQNWNGNVVFGSNRTYMPKNLIELQSILKDDSCCPPPIRVVGRGHSFSPLAECHKGTLISLRYMSRILDFQPPTKISNGSLTVEGGATYTDAAQFLGRRGALRNLPSCPQFTVAGAIATATHGSGIHHENLAADITMIEFVCGDGTLKRYDLNDNHDTFRGCRIHLGCLGVISKLTLEIFPYFEVESVRYDDVPLTAAIKELPNLWKTCDSLSMWTSGFGKGDGAGNCWLCFRYFINPEEEESQEVKSSVHIPLDDTILGRSGHICKRQLPRYCTDPLSPQLFEHTRLRAPWATALSLTMDLETKETNMTTVDLQSEFFVPIEFAVEAIYAVWGAAKEWTFTSPWGYSKGPVKKGIVDAMEFRQVKGNDGGWLSPHAVDSLGIHISFNGDPTLRERIINECVPQLENALQSFSPRAHWGKLACKLYQPEYIQRTYGNKLLSFRKLCESHDPEGKFRNMHLERMLFSPSTSKL